MKNYFLLFMFVLKLTNAQASHLIGGELTYECLGAGLYQINFTFYNDCSSSSAPTSISCNVVNHSCNTTEVLTLTPLIPNTTQIVPQCGQLSTCEGGNNPGIQKTIFSGTFILPNTCPFAEISIIMSSRTTYLTTVYNSGFYNFYLNANLIDSNNLFCDHSPVFINDPVIFTCVNQPYCLNSGVFDPDGDSLVCSLVNPMDNFIQPLPYDTGYSSIQFLQSNPPITIDSRTGVICFTPTQPVMTVYTLQVESYRNNELIGIVKRDIILYAINCSNSQPDLTGLNGSGVFDTTICVNSQTCFDIISTDPNFSDSTKIYWDYGIGGATFNTTTSKNESGLFCWTPGMPDISVTPHCFNVSVSDNSCPAKQNNIRQYCITVVDSQTCILLSMDKPETKKIEFLIYPQLSSSTLNFFIGNQTLKEKIYCMIIGAKGECFYYREVLNENNSIDGFLPGIYMICLLDKNGSIMERKKFVII